MHWRSPRSGARVRGAKIKRRGNQLAKVGGVRGIPVLERAMPNLENGRGHSGRSEVLEMKPEGRRGGK